jgi:hypothetical protein
MSSRRLGPAAVTGLESHHSENPGAIRVRGRTPAGQRSTSVPFAASMVARFTLPSRASTVSL